MHGRGLLRLVRAAGLTALISLPVVAQETAPPTQPAPPPAGAAAAPTPSTTTPGTTHSGNHHDSRRCDGADAGSIGQPAAARRCHPEEGAAGSEGCRQEGAAEKAGRRSGADPAVCRAAATRYAGNLSARRRRHRQRHRADVAGRGQLDTDRQLSRRRWPRQCRGLQPHRLYLRP